MRKRSRSSIEYNSRSGGSMINHEENTLTNTVSFTYHKTLTNSALSNLTEISISNSGSLESMNEYSNTAISEINGQSNNTYGQEQSDITIINTAPSDIHDHIDTRLTTFDANSHTMDYLSVTFVQTTIDSYFPSQNTYLSISNLNQSTLEFNIRCKVIYKSMIGYFGTNSKVFGALICDYTGEIKLVAFNDEVDKFYNSINVNEIITIENGDVKLANEKYRSQYSPFEIRLLSISRIQPYRCTGFLPMMAINKQDLRHVALMMHGLPVDVEGLVIMDEGIIATISQNTGEAVLRRSLRIKDPTGCTYITIWNNKVNEKY